MSKKISVIIPIYKVEKYLNRCVESVANQSYRNLEIILVDDGSPDTCAQLCDQWAAKDLRIKVIHKINGGLSDARNAGMELITGDYVSFIDSDDWIHVNMFKKLALMMEQHSADICECGFQRSFGKVRDNYIEEKVVEMDCVTAMRSIVTQDIKPVVWNKLYKAELVLEHKFEVGKYNEDEYWTYLVIDKANKVVQTNEELYYYFYREDSIINEKYSLKRLDGLEARYQRMLYLKKYPEIQKIAKKNLLFECMYHYQQGINYLSKKDVQSMKEIIHNIMENVRFTKEDKKIFTVKEKIWYTLSRFSFEGVCKLRNKLGYGI